MEIREIDRNPINFIITKQNKLQTPQKRENMLRNRIPDRVLQILLNPINLECVVQCTKIKKIGACHVVCLGLVLVQFVRFIVMHQFVLSLTPCQSFALVIPCQVSVSMFYFETTPSSRPPRSSIASGSTQFPRPLPSISFNQIPSCSSFTWSLSLVDYVKRRKFYP